MVAVLCLTRSMSTTFMATAELSVAPPSVMRQLNVALGWGDVRGRGPLTQAEVGDLSGLAKEVERRVGAGSVTGRIDNASERVAIEAIGPTPQRAKQLAAGLAEGIIENRAAAVTQQLNEQRDVAYMLERLAGPGQMLMSARDRVRLLELFQSSRGGVSVARAAGAEANGKSPRILRSTLAVGVLSTLTLSLLASTLPRKPDR